MKTFLKIIGALCIIVLSIGAVIFFFFPQKIIDFTNAQYANTAELELKTLMVSGYQVHYFASHAMDKKETIVLVHGMGDDKNSFLQSAELLSKEYNLILPDLLGHGENAHDNDKDYSIEGQSSFLHQFIEALSLSSFHIVGNSMGGHVAATYAIRYPKQLKTLTLLNAAGVKLDTHEVYTGFGKEIETDEEFNAVLDRVFFKRPSLPSPIQKHMITTINNSKDWVDNTLVPAIKNGNYFNLKDKLHRITVPTLILWGKHDQVVPETSAHYYNTNIRFSTLQFLEKAGHSPQLETPNEVAIAIDSFLKKPTYDMQPKTKIQHVALTQYYRWYQLYEREMTPSRIANQMDILSDDVRITSAAGTMKGKENYPERLAAYAGWQNAHHVKNVTVTTTETDTIQIEADIHYQNIKPNDEKSSYSIHYSAQLKRTEDMLPVFTYIKIQPTAELSEPFRDNYPENRIKSLMHYWLANMESLDGNSEPFKEILTNEFKLEFSTQQHISTMAQLHEWLNGVPLTLVQSNHYPENLAIEELGDHRYQLTVEFDWYGMTKDGKKLHARTHHTWHIKDDINDRFAKIKQVTVEQIVPLSIVE